MKRPCTRCGKPKCLGANNRSGLCRKCGQAQAKAGCCRVCKRSLAGRNGSWCQSCKILYAQLCNALEGPRRPEPERSLVVAHYAARAAAQLPLFAERG